jgi:hypothetical protein
MAIKGFWCFAALEAEDLMAKIECSHYGNTFKANDLARCTNISHLLIKVVCGRKQLRLLLGWTGDLIFFIEYFNR